MNTAARLEGANKTLETKVLVSREAMERTGLDWFRPMGRINLRGRATPVEVFEPVPVMSEADKAISALIISAHDLGDSAAVQTLTDTMPESAKDDAMINLLQRLQQTHKGESYVLG